MAPTNSRVSGTRQRVPAAVKLHADVRIRAGRLRAAGPARIRAEFERFARPENQQRQSYENPEDRQRARTSRCEYRLEPIMFQAFTVMYRLLPKSGKILQPVTIR